MKEFTKEERLQVYKYALEYFTAPGRKMIHKNAMNGICEALWESLRVMDDAAGWDVSKFPEFLAFKPKKVWAAFPNYWFSFYISEGGYEIRESILEALTEDKTPMEWWKEWGYGSKFSDKAQFEAMTRYRYLTPRDNKET